MKSMRVIRKYHELILKASREEIAVKEIKVRANEQDCFNHALQDLIIDGMVKYTSLNPILKIKRIT